MPKGVRSWLANPWRCRMFQKLLIFQIFTSRSIWWIRSKSGLKSLTWPFFNPQPLRFEAWDDLA